MDESGDGYCVSGRYIEDYLAGRKLMQMQKQLHEPPFDIAVAAIDAIAERNISKLATLIHPKNGILLSEKPAFGDGSRHYTRQSLLAAYPKSEELLWGHDDAKGDPIRKSLFNYFEDILPTLGGLTRIDKESGSWRHFDRKLFPQIAGYSLRWINPHSATRDYDWRGVVITLAPYRGKWYVVGLLRDYWTI
jgi:hypothetical protein